MPEQKTYDVLIVGAGISGALMAYTLAKAGKSVLVLDGGPEIPDDRSPYMEQFYLSMALYLSVAPTSASRAARPGIGSELPCVYCPATLRSIRITCPRQLRPWVTKRWTGLSLTTNLNHSIVQPKRKLESRPIRPTKTISG